MCSFISEYPSIRIESRRKDETQIDLITCQNEAATLYADVEVIELFYQEQHRYDWHSLNRGASKEPDHFNDVCIVPGGTHRALLAVRRLNELSPAPRNKLGVACPRPGAHLVLPGSLLRQFIQ